MRVQCFSIFLLLLLLLLQGVTYKIAVEEHAVNKAPPRTTHNIDRRTQTSRWRCLAEQNKTHTHTHTHRATPNQLFVWGNEKSIAPNSSANLNEPLTGVLLVHIRTTTTIKRVGHCEATYRKAHFSALQNATSNCCWYG